VQAGTDDQIITGFQYPKLFWPLVIRTYLELGIWLLKFTLFCLKKLYSFSGGNRGDGMFIDQPIRLASKDDTEIIKTENHPFYLMTCGHLNHNLLPIRRTR